MRTNEETTQLNKKEYVIVVDDVLHWLNEYNGPKFQFVLSDPPYAINHLGGWDSTGIAYNTDLYNSLLRVMQPGAFLCFYGFARTHHRVMTAMEDTGFIIHKALFAWVYTTGNPLGAANLQHRVDDFYASNYGGYCTCDNPRVGRKEKAFILPKFSSNALDVSICDHCRKPIREIIKNISWGSTGGMKLLGGSGYGNNNQQIIAKSMTPEAEVLKDYTYGLAWSKPMLEPIILAQKPFDTKDQITGILKYGTGIINVHAARYTSRWPGNFIAVHSPECYMDELTGEWHCTCDLGVYASRDKEFYEKIPTFGYGVDDLHLASIDWLNYDNKPSKNERHAGINGRNPHTSVKPIDVNKYIGGLFLPPKEFGIRRALVPFSGSGSEVIGLLHSGWDSVYGIELDDKYAQISYLRVNHFVNFDVRQKSITTDNSANFIFQRK